MNKNRVEELIRELIVEIGEDPDREGLIDTPKRVAKSFEFLTEGYRLSVKDVVNKAVFTTDTDNMVISRDIEIYSMCEHHMLPFYGKCHIGYTTKKKLIGVSKLARIVDTFARRLQIQERLTCQIANAIKDEIDADGVGVVMECRHLCMMMRGVQKQNSVMTTSEVLGSFRKNSNTRAEFMNLITRNNSF